MSRIEELLDENSGFIALGCNLDEIEEILKDFETLERIKEFLSTKTEREQAATYRFNSNFVTDMFSVVFAEELTAFHDGTIINGSQVTVSKSPNAKCKLYMAIGI